MPGGLMNLVAPSQQNVRLSNNPTKSFFRAAYRQYTNFGLQKFRLDYEGSKTLRLSDPSTFTFKIKRYGDLLMDCYLVVRLPSIWSPILPPQDTMDSTASWAPYEFKWIEHVGAKMISKVKIVCGNYTLQEYSGDYLLASVQRDFTSTKKALFDEMIGHVPALVNPAHADARVNAYPNAYYDGTPEGPEPSIASRVLYIPLNTWFGLQSEMAFPLVALQYNELQIEITLRPLNQLFVIRDVLDAENNFPYVAPNFNQWYMQLHRFLQPPPSVAVAMNDYHNTRSDWNADVHLLSTYAFLANDERQHFARHEQTYLMKQVHESIHYNVTGANKIALDSLGMVTGWLFYFQRSDANLRNEWSNYSNWPYNYPPVNVVQAPTSGSYVVYRTNPTTGGLEPVSIGPGVNPDGTLTGLVVNQVYSQQNMHQILEQMGILLDGEYRENMLPVGVYAYLEKYVKTTGNAPPGLFCYLFSLHANNATMQPSGGINLNRFLLVELEFVTILPPLNPLAQSMVICNPETGEVIGVNKPTWNIYEYNFDLHVFEERINFVKFMGGNVGLEYAT